MATAAVARQAMLSPSVDDSDHWTSSGAVTAPTPKAKCSAFMDGPTPSPRDHTSKVLLARSMAPAPVPMRQNTTASAHSDESSGTRATTTPNPTSDTASRRLPHWRSMPGAASSEPNR